MHAHIKRLKLLQNFKQTNERKENEILMWEGKLKQKLNFILACNKNFDL